MKYILFNLHNKEIDKYQKNIVNKLSKEFNSKMTKHENISAHFTLKYSFDANDKQLNELKEMLLNFSKTHIKQKTKVGGYDNFNKKIVFIKVSQSQKIKTLISQLHIELRTLKWMPWSNVESNGIHLHTTIFEESNEKVYLQIRKYLEGKEKYFDSYLDNVSIMKLSQVKKPKRKWILEKRFNLQ